MPGNAYIYIPDLEVWITFSAVLQCLLNSLDRLINVQYLPMLHTVAVCAPEAKNFKFTIFIFSARDRSNFGSANVKPYNNRHASIIIYSLYCIAVCTLVHRLCFSCFVVIEKS